MKRVLIGLLVTAMAFALMAGCAKKGVGRPEEELSEAMDATLLSVLDEPSQAFFESFTEHYPTYMTVHYDQHYPEAVVTDHALMKQMCYAMLAIRVTGKTNIASTDGYHSVQFITKNGEKYGIGFENSVLCENGERYVLDNAKEFWKLFKTVAEDGWTQAQENAALFESTPVTYEAAPGSRVACTVQPVETAETADGVWLDTRIPLTFTNTGDTPITGVIFRMTLLDTDGYRLGESEEVADFFDAPIAPGETREYTAERQVYCFAYKGVLGALIHVSGLDPIRPDALKTGETLFAFYNNADVTAFAENFYTDPPASLTFVLDRLDGFEDTVTDAETIQAVFEALKPIVVVEQVDEFYTDFYTHLIFTYADGREYAFSFNEHNLEIYTPASPYSLAYRLSGGEPLWALIQGLYDR